MLWKKSERLQGGAASHWRCERYGRKLESDGKPSAEAVVLVHGLFLFGFYFWPLARRLAKDGYSVYICDYRTRKLGIREHGERFLAALESVAKDFGPSPGSLHIVTHSLGGVVARVALSSLEEAPGGRVGSLGREAIGRTVMLAPPNKGSDVAKAVSEALPWSGRFAKPLPELSSAPGSEIHSIPSPKSFEIGVIAGTCDIEVALPYTALDGAKARKELRSDHTFMPFYPHVYRELSCFLKNGSFME